MSIEKKKKFQMAFSRRLKSLRVASGFETGEEFAKVLKLKCPTYRAYERGDHVPHLFILADIAKLTDCSLDWLIAGHGQPRRDNGKSAQQKIGT